MKAGFQAELDIHAGCLRTAKGKVEVLLSKSSTDNLQNCVDELNQIITNFVQSAAAMQKLAASPHQQ